MKSLLRKVGIVVAAAMIMGFGVAVAMAGNGHGPPTGGPPGQGECEHGNSGKDCKPDPQPGHGKDCEKHGKKGGVNEDHCTPTETTPTETTPTETTPTDTTPTTPTDTTPTTPTDTTPGMRCPPGQGPYAGKDGAEGNDECCPDVDNNQQCDTATPPPTQPSGTQNTLSTTTTATPATTETTATPSSTAAPQTPAAKSTKKTTTAVKEKVATPKPKQKVKLTGNPKKDKCKPAPGNTLNCQGIIVVPGNG